MINHFWGADETKTGEMVENSYVRLSKPVCDLNCSLLTGLLQTECILVQPDTVPLGRGNT